MNEYVVKDCWSWYEKILFRFVFIFTLGFICSFSFPHQLIPDIGKYTSPFFERIVQWFSKDVLRLKPPYSTKLYSDTTGLYVDALMLLILSAAGTLVWLLLAGKRSNDRVLFYWFRAFVCYYLAMQLALYGADKIFKTQFYLPEPNTLYTTLGDMPRDLLYWSCMGISRPYNIFTGSIEILCALLLLFNRTRFGGALLSVLVLSNVLMINLSFDISVKLYSAFLLFLTVVLVIPYLPGKLRTTGNADIIRLWRPVFDTKYKQRMYVACKALVILFIITDTLWGYVLHHNFNDDTAPRPLLHGAYHVTWFVRNNDTLPPLETDTSRWRRVFIHRRGYFITQSMNDEMQDYRLRYDTANKYLMISDAGDVPKGLFHYTRADDTSLLLNGNIGEDSVAIFLRKLDTGGLPLFKDSFHFTVDE